ncbi:MAG TPA: hypothetical protein PLQ98_09955 [Bacillota bacterium]|nr:hypothetical protein [Bacillota bacterium]
MKKDVLKTEEYLQKRPLTICRETPSKMYRTQAQQAVQTAPRKTLGYSPRPETLTYD